MLPLLLNTFLLFQPVKVVSDVSIGDSITRGWLDDIGTTSYPAQLGAVNLGVPGYTSQQVLYYEMGPAVDHYQSGAWLYIMAGTNDALMQVPISSVFANLQRMVQLGQRNGFKVMLLTIPAALGYATRPTTFDDQRFQENNWIMSNVVQADAVCDAGNAPGLTFGSDGLHPDTAGYRVLANYIRACRNR